MLAPARARSAYKEFGMNRSLLIVLALATTMAACSGSNSTSTTAPAPATMTDPLSGTVAVGGFDFHNFTVAQSGTVSITLVTATPPPTIFMGLGVGTPGTGTCSVNSADTTVTPPGLTAQLSFTLAAGNYCVEVYDVGNQASPVTYSVTVSHP
jgi:hypothetical protein